MSTPTLDPEDRRDDDKGRDKRRDENQLVTPGLFAVLAVSVLGLLIAVVVIGLARRQLDATGVATVLSTVLSGIVVGALVNARGKGGGSP